MHDLCYNRLTAYRCHWGKCNAVLESAKRLGMHAKTHIIEYRDARARTASLSTSAAAYTFAAGTVRMPMAGMSS